MDALHATVDYHDPPKLTITNCDFLYFLKDYEALILVETANFARTEEEELVFLMGEDRGADITIENISVKHSRFCKGMLAYVNRDVQHKRDIFEFPN